LQNKASPEQNAQAKQLNNKNSIE